MLSVLPPNERYFLYIQVQINGKLKEPATFHIIHGMGLADHRATIRTIPCSGPRRQDNSSANGHDNRKIAETDSSLRFAVMENYL